MSTTRAALAEYLDETLLGRRVGDYLVTALHGQGPIADVYLAEHAATGRRVCIKVLPPEGFPTQASRARLTKRVELVRKRLDHPCIDQPIELLSDEDGYFYLVTEARPGRVLSRLVNREGPLREKTALKVIRLAARILGHAHSSGLVHGNLKPSNLLLTTDGRLVILDWASIRTSAFFIQNRLPPDLIRSSDIDPGMAYVAPEIAKEDDDIVPACDFFSLGATLCFLLSGRPPFDGSDKTLKLKVAYADVPDVIDQIPGIRVGTARLILKMMHPEPGKRVKIADQLWQELDRVLAR